MIKILDKGLADKIAAGEVVDRPISIVKELVENSIDANASSITVEIKSGGKDYIRVTDDGEGIEPNELSMAFVRHATSKILNETDLERINTLGFRGEALASIAAVSRVKLISKTENEKIGAGIRISGGEIIKEEQIGAPKGTTIVVSDLFFNTPARQKFLKSNAAEAGLIIDFLSKIALAYSDIKFRVINNGTILFATNGKNDKYKNILSIYSKDYNEKLLKVEKENEEMRIEAYISKPELTKTNRRQQIFFVNGRVISSKVLDTGVIEGYKERLFEGRYPVVFLFFEILPELVDVNIHPNKKEVRFKNEEAVMNFVAEAITEKLTSLSASPNILKKNIEIETIIKEPIDYKIDRLKASSELREKDSFDSWVFDENQEEKAEDKGKGIAEDETNSPDIEDEFLESEQVDIKKILLEISEEELQKEELPELQEEFNPELDSLKVLTVVFNTYIVASYENIIYLIDQHAAHERIFYEKFLEEYKSGEKIHQVILLPIIRQTSLELSAFEDSWIELLDKLGFKVELFGERTYRVTEIPVFMQISEAEAVLDYFLENIKEGKDIDNFVKIDKLIMRSCKAAVKGGDILSILECEELLKSLSRCRNPYSCPHGRPTFIKLGKNEIEKMFKRI